MDVFLFFFVPTYVLGTVSVSDGELLLVSRGFGQSSSSSKTFPLLYRARSFVYQSVRLDACIIVQDQRAGVRCRLECVRPLC